MRFRMDSYEYAKANIYLLDFESHDDFLMTYATEQDKCYMDHPDALLQILKLGYRYLKFAFLMFISLDLDQLIQRINIIVR